MSRYPKKSNWISCEKDEETGNYRIENHLLDTFTFEMTPEEMSFLNRLDGKVDPIDILKNEYGFKTFEAVNYLEYLYDCEALRTSRGFRIGFLSFLYTLVEIKDSTKYRPLAVCIYFLMAIGFFPMIYVSVQAFWKILECDHLTGSYDSTAFLWLGIFVGVFAGISLHEIGHAIAAITFGGRVLEFGVGIKGFLAAYTLVDDTMLSSFLKRTLIMLAGPTVNLFIVGACLHCNLQTERFTSFFSICALINFELFLFNLLPAQGFDGMRALDLLVGKKSLWNETKHIFVVWRKRKGLYRRRKDYSQNFRVGIAMAFMVCVTRLAAPILILYDICLIFNF